MRTLCIIGLWLLAVPVSASDSLRIGSRLLVSGDSAAQVRQLLGRPSRITHRRASRRRHGVALPASERWLYRRGGREITVVLVHGVVHEILQRP